jgi:hypothetical protein
LKEVLKEDEDVVLEELVVVDVLEPEVDDELEALLAYREVPRILTLEMVRSHFVYII